MSCGCTTYGCLTALYDPCSAGIQLNVTANETATWTVLIEFNGTIISQSIGVINAQKIVIANKLNENYKHLVRIYNAAGTLVNNTCYWLAMQYSQDVSYTPIPAEQTVESMNFTTADGDTVYTIPDLITAALLDVRIEGVDLLPGTDYTFNTSTGVLTILKEISDGQVVFIIYKK